MQNKNRKKQLKTMSIVFLPSILVNLQPISHINHCPGKGGGGRFYSTSSSRAPPRLICCGKSPIFVKNFHILFNSRAVLFVFVPMALYLTFLNYLQLFTLCYLTMNFYTRLWEFCAGYFFLLSFLLARTTTTSSPTGSDDFILLLYSHIVHQLVKLGQKNSRYGKSVIAKGFVGEEFSIT